MGCGGSRYGAGRPGWHIKAEHCLRLDVRKLARSKVLGGGAFAWRWTNSDGEESGSITISSFPDRLHLSFTQNGKPGGHEVGIVRTACNFGGTRPWLLCAPCGVRVAVLYLRGGRFICRHCARVVYASQSEDLIGRAWRRQAKLEARLGEHWKRPKGMHQATRHKLVAAILACEELRDRAISDFARRMGMLDDVRG
jgi:hypothetical protein